MRELLSPVLGTVNPSAYRAHYARLDAEGRRGYLAGLSAAELRAHLHTLGERAVVGLVLSLEVPCLDAVVSGKPFPRAMGEADCVGRSREVEELVSSLGGATVTGLIDASPAQLEAGAPLLRALGWTVTALAVHSDPCAGPDEPQGEWSIRGTVEPLAGTFWSPRRLIGRGAFDGTVAQLRLAGRALGAEVSVDGA